MRIFFWIGGVEPPTWGIPRNREAILGQLCLLLQSLALPTELNPAHEPQLTRWGRNFAQAGSRALGARLLVFACQKNFQ